MNIDVWRPYWWPFWKSKFTMLFCVQRRYNSKKKILKFINFCVCRVAILNITAILAAILKNRVDEDDIHIERMQLKKKMFEIHQLSLLAGRQFEYSGHIGGHFEKHELTRAIPTLRGCNWKKKFLKSINFHFWQVAILNIAAILAAILKNKVSHDASRMEHILSAKNGIKIRYRLARLREHARTHARTHTRTHTGWKGVLPLNP